MDLCIIESETQQCISVRKLAFDTAFTTLFLDTVQQQLDSESSPEPDWENMLGNADDILEQDTLKYSAVDRA